MFNIFNKTKEVAQTRKAIEVCILDNVASREIKIVALKSAENKEKVLNALNNEGFTTETLAHALITNAISALLGTGKYHVYRGTLNAMGKAMLESWDYSIDQLEKLGKYSSEDAVEDKQWIRNEVANFG